MLHVTNGDSTVRLLRAAGFEGTIVPWRDILHEGPVPADAEPPNLRTIRAEFLAAEGCGERDKILQQLERRDRRLMSFRKHEETVLWFEHDLYDQLQLIEILDRLATSGVDDADVYLICIDRFPGVHRFLGLGQLMPDQVRLLTPKRQRVGPIHLELGRRVWAAFRDPDPHSVEHLIGGDTSALPFLSSALRRHLEQLPSVRDGLGRTEHGILTAASSGDRTAADLFRADQDAEPAPFLGDTTFFAYVRRLALGTRPLLGIDAMGEHFATSRISLTADGRAVLRGERDAVRLNRIDRWWGGVHQAGHEIRWRWDRAGSRLVDAEAGR